MSGRKLSFLAASIAITLLASTVGISAASSAPTDPSVDAQMGAPVTDAADCPGTPIANYAMAADPYGMFGIAQEIGAEAYYRDGFFGQGIDVALIDSGVTEVSGMQSGNLVHGPDLSFESQAAHDDDPDERNDDLAYRDTYGHGTHMAGIIAGRDRAWRDFDWKDPSAFRGIAPGSRIVSVKVADAMGAADLTQIIAAIDWVVQNKNKNGLNIRVLNLSLGIDGKNYTSDVLAFAVEQAWKNGIVVVAAAGNSGHSPNPFAGSQKLPSPASDPHILAVGSYDSMGTIGPNKHQDDQSSDFTQQGSSDRKVDVVAPGEHVMSLHVRGSHSDDEIKEDCETGVSEDGRWTSPIAGTDERFVRGSGTSQSAAIVSGAAALILSDPKTKDLDPVAVRRLLMTKARPLCSEHSRMTDGLGEVNLSNDDKCVRGEKSKSTKAAAKFKTPPAAKGTGSLEAARGSAPLPCMTSDSVRANRGTRVAGTTRYEGGLCSSHYARRASVEVDIHGHPIQTRGAGGLADREAKRNAWTVDTDGGWHWMDGPAWFGSPITVGGRPQWPTKAWDSDWLGVRWKSGDWSGVRWKGTRWSGDDWEGVRWKDSAWSGVRWKGVRWKGDNFSGTRWSGTRWSSAIFRDHSWR